ncbi:MAG: PilZ domain-containing protein [Deltaproteobacteria bacterium]|nr:PilZ domain-containing protein [Deltaproteobacteria bacterium]
MTEQGNINLLMVDERSLSTTLDHEGYRNVGVHAFISSNLDEIQANMRKHAIDVVLIDLEYRYLNPIEIIKFIKSNKEWKRIPIIVTSVHGCDDTIKNMEEIALFVKQPMPRVILLEKIRILLGKGVRGEDRYGPHDIYLDRVKVNVEGETHMLSLGDLSLSGIFLYSDVNFHKGSQIYVEFKLPGIPQSIQVMGEIVRTARTNKISDPMNKGIGVQFIEFQGMSKQALSEFLDKNKPESNFMTYYL